MGIRNIRTEDDPILKKRAKEVNDIDDKIRALVKDMMDTMHKYKGVGLAAPQIGILKRIIVIDLYDEGPCFALINPTIEKSKGTQTVSEGCLSFPNQFGQVERPEEVVVKGEDEYGKRTTIKASGLLAQALCHEIDHLNGIVFIDKVIPGTLEVVQPEEEEEKDDK